MPLNREGRPVSKGLLATRTFAFGAPLSGRNAIAAVPAYLHPAVSELASHHHSWAARRVGGVFLYGREK